MTSGFDRVTLGVAVAAAVVVSVVAFATGAVAETYLAGAVLVALLVAIVGEIRRRHDAETTDSNRPVYRKNAASLRARKLFLAAGITLDGPEQ